MNPITTARPDKDDDDLRFMLGAIAAEQYRATDEFTQIIIAGAVEDLKAKWPRLTTNAALAAIAAASTYFQQGD